MTICPYCGRPDGRDYLCLPASCGRRSARAKQLQIGLAGDGARLSRILRAVVKECRRLADARRLPVTPRDTAADPEGA